MYNLNPVESWKMSFTDPKRHDNKHFCYIVWAHHEQFNEDFMAAVEKAGNKMNYIDIFKNPESIAKRPVISASVITNEHTQTFGQTGYILSVPVENILLLSPRDINILVKDNDEM